MDIVGAAKESSAYACTLCPPRHLGNPMSVVPPLATQGVPGETDSSFAACVSAIGEGRCCYAPVLADLFTIPLCWAGLPRPIRGKGLGCQGPCKRRALDFNLRVADFSPSTYTLRIWIAKVSNHDANSLPFPACQSASAKAASNPGSHNS